MAAQLVQGRVCWVSPDACVLLGWTSRELCGEPYARFAVEARTQPDYLKTVLDAARALGRIKFFGTHQLRDGRLRQARITAWEDGNALVTAWKYTDLRLNGTQTADTCVSGMLRLAGDGFVEGLPALFDRWAADLRASGLRDPTIDTRINHVKTGEVNTCVK